MITWRNLEEADFGLLGEWLENEHVKRWWNHETTPEAVARDFSPTIRGEEPNEDLLVSCDGVPVGLVQRCRLNDYAEDLAEFAAAVPVSDGAMIIDYLIGDPDRVGQGLGPRIIREVVASTWTDHPGCGEVLVAVSAANRPSWRALEKAGGTRIAEAEMTPDNPIDDRRHFVYRFARPA
ncbi:GNAT family N-acetyltransferase [Amycolatopsis suaedae]|uniref:N-acetyltransferase n=1 Tax=Amycolatopsis suaedae TaxID=2510978 RepID=A0A4V2ELH9_9PSEU|nr:GNAT family N-acetyltransferase [Amycolatopsis suaedae]RZQ61625.1 N-acetyltransferase [Amycolatopsis suaedae]